MGRRWQSDRPLGRTLWAWLALVALTMASCDDKPRRRKKKKPAAAAAAPAATDTPAPEERPQLEMYSYQAVGKRDPFHSYLADMKEAGKKEVRSRRAEPTEEYERAQYSLTGVVTGTAQPKALVEDPKGKGHVVHIGTRLGRRGGVVTRITNIGVVVTEEFRAPTGEKVRVPYLIKLPQPELDIAGDSE